MADIFDFSDPNQMGLLGLIQGLGAASAPSRLPITNGMVLGSAAGGLAQGAREAQEYKRLQQENALQNLTLQGWQNYLGQGQGIPGNGRANAVAATAPQGYQGYSPSAIDQSRSDLAQGSQGYSPSAIDQARQTLSRPTIDASAMLDQARRGLFPGGPGATMFGPAASLYEKTIGQGYQGVTLPDGSQGVAPLGGIDATRFMLAKADSMGKTAGEKQQSINPITGAWENDPGSLGANAASAGATAAATSRAQLPAEIQKIIAETNQKSGVTPFTYDTDDGFGNKVTYLTNNLRASQGQPGAPVQHTIGEVNKPISDQLAKNQLAVPAAQGAIADINELRGALNGLPTGPGTEITNEAAAALARIGVNANDLLPAGYATDPTKYQIAAKNINQLAMAVAQANFPTRVTNTDLLAATRATPNFFNNPDANKVLLDNLEAQNRLKIERGQFDNNWLAQHNGLPDYRINQDWQQHLSGLKNIPEGIKQSFGSVTDQAGNPQSGQGGAIHLPTPLKDGTKATNYAIVNGQTIYRWQKPDGTYFKGDATGKPI